VHPARVGDEGQRAVRRAQQQEPARPPALEERGDVVAARFTTLNPLPGGNVKVDLDMGPGGLADGLSATSIAAAARTTGGVAGLSAMGLTLAGARTIARATLGLTPAEANACTDDYLFELCLGLAKQNASLETWYGRPPYSPGETEAHRVIRSLPRLNLP
jgi:hypothetical protein